MEAVGQPGTGATEVLPPPRPRLIAAAWSSFVTSDNRFARRAATVAERASLGSFLLASPLSSKRAPRAASLGGTSTTLWPAATSAAKLAGLSATSKTFSLVR